MSEYIGSRVSIPGTRGYGILKYYGPIEGKQGFFAGIELTGPIAASRGKNSGSVNGVQYFDVLQPMTGLFLPIERLKQSNPQLSSINYLSGFQETLLSTPSPSSRNRTRTSSRNNLSPIHLNNQIINISKRELKKAVLKADLNSSRKTSLYSTINQSRKSLDELSDRIKLQKEFNELKQKYDANEKEMQNKIAILNELRNSVNDLQPLLEEYELELSEKDNKLNKQRTDFEKAREEWRQSLDLLVSSHLETEIIYQQKLHDLHQHIEKIMKEKDDILNNQPNSNNNKSLPSSETIDKFNLKIQDLELEKSLLEKNTSSKIKSQEIQIKQLTESLATCQQDLGELTKASSYQQLTGSTEDDEKIEELEKQVKKLSQDNDSLQFIIDDLQAKIKTKDTTINQLEDKLDEVEISKVNEGIKSVDLNDNSNVAELGKIIMDLKHQLEIRPTFDELSELQKSLDEIDSLHQSELENNAKQIASLTRDNQTLQAELAKSTLLVQQMQKDIDANAGGKKAEINPIGTNSSDGQLPIYKPLAPTDPSSGKEDWCGLCERDGHSSINCPYENDMF